MAGAGFKTFNTGDVLLASEVNTYLMQQTVMVFDDAAARTTALTGVVAEGMLSYLKDTNAVERYDGSAWGAIGAGDIEGVTAGTGISGGGSSGTVTITNSMATAIDAKGDLIVGTGADTFDRLAVGTNGYTLVADSGETTGLKWAAPAAASGPSFQAYMSNGGNNQTPANNTWTKVIMDTETWDTDSCYNTTDRRFTPNKAGYYLFTYAISNQADAAASNRVMTIWKNGAETTNPYVRGYQGGAPSANWSIGASVMMYANGTTDYFEMYILINDATARQVNTNFNNGSTYWNAVWIRS